MITRRTALKNIALTTGALALSGATLSAQAPAAAPTPEGVFKLPPLGYDYDALEPHIDAETMKIHHDKHHAAYVSKLNEAVASAPGLEKKSIEEILAKLPEAPQAVRTALQNHGGGHANHSLFWQSLKKGENQKPAGELVKAMEKAFTSVPKFTEDFSAAAMAVFGSGWAWLVYRDGKLAIEKLPNQDSPLMTGGVPLLGLDVWEHAYYLKYQNRRAEYVKAFQNVINWDVVSARYAKALKPA
ncbi:MAG TPA: superoxide dismutase [Chthoniobacteraceae bacterium]|jgi:Fe-Mn family superoxide dismutase|nr:Superoxide dismutase [Chthoniobacter sp.]HEV7869507.1 superoxide dismutase [Chthoniobacteraceae bacterium]